jgi:hypothetical protein
MPFFPWAKALEPPLGGHLDAPFFATIERKNLEEGGSFNPYLLRQCRLLALEAAVAAKAVLDDEPARRVVADFLFWTGDGSNEVRTNLLEREDLLIPAEPRWGKPAWAGLRSAPSDQC